ncbi:MAG TPA: hypothetical protein PLV45_08825 [bacterium]|nr:hypothetical protein [bacterium]
MCTIGVVRNKETGRVIFFKNVDQTFACRYPDAFIRSGERYRYLKIPSNSDPMDNGVLAGVNEAGVVVLGADGNCMPNYCGSAYGSLNDSLVVYEEVLSTCGTVWEAMQCVMKEYQERQMGGNGDIIIVGDRDETVALEYSPDRWGIEFMGRKPYMVRSNFFVLMDRLRPAPEENTLHTSSAIRYSDALKCLSVKGSLNTLDDVFGLVRSHEQGLTAMSICRHGGEGEYFTHASFVAELRRDGVDAYVMLNTRPCEGEYRRFTF